MSTDTNEILKQFQPINQSLFGDVGDIVNKEECTQMLYFFEKNKSMLNPNVFYMLLDNRIGAITWSLGLFKYMGYADIDKRDTGLMLIEVLSWIRPEELPVFLSNAISVYQETFKHPEFLKSYRKSISYQIEVHMKNNSGKYFHLLQQSLAMGLDAKNQLVTQLNIYTIIADGYRDNVIPKSVLYVDAGKQHPLSEEVYKQIPGVLSKFKVLKFGVGHQQIIKAYKEDGELTVPQLVKQLKLSEHSIRKYQKDILQKINTAFGMTFTSLKPALQSLFISRIL